MRLYFPARAWSLIVALAASPAVAQHVVPKPAQSYTGQETRAIATLSSEDVAALMAGKGWGLAKPAELNGYPGPAHVLELAGKLQLTDAQKRRVELIFKRMEQRAKSLGPRYVAAEAALDRVFKSGATNTGSLETLLRDAERLRSELRRAHLQAHVETTPILSQDQRKKYAELRGYGAGDNAGEHGHQQHKH